MTKQDFRDYIAAFNRGDFDGFGRFYADDVVLRLGRKKELHGRDAILDFYRGVLELCEETLTIRDIIADEEGLAAELDTEFKAKVDAPDFIAGPLRKGESIFITSFVHYKIRDGRFARIQSARVGG